MRKSIKNTVTGEVLEITKTMTENPIINDVPLHATFDPTTQVMIQTISWGSLALYEDSFDSEHNCRKAWCKMETSTLVDRSLYNEEYLETHRSCRMDFNINNPTSNCNNCVCLVSLNALISQLGSDWERVDNDN